MSVAPSPDAPRMGHVWAVYLWPLLLALVVTGLGVMLGPTRVVKLAIVGGAILAGIIFWVFMPVVRHRLAALHVCHNVSASGCHDQFLALARRLCQSEKRARHHWHVLQHIAVRRKHPNARTLHRMNEELPGGLTEEGIRRVHGVVRYITEAKARTRTEVRRHVREYLSTAMRQHTYLVLFGFSQAICEALKELPETRDRTVLLVEDKQYGARSYREHARARRALRKTRLDVYTVKYKYVARLFSDDQVIIPVGRLGWRAVTLRRDRTMLVMIGCEAYATDGDVLIPAEMGETVNDTSTFIELVHDARTKLKSRVKLIVVSESYKLHRAFDGGDASVYPPIGYGPRSWLKIARYLSTGKPEHLPGMPVRLVTIRPPDVTMVIDDTGRHSVKGGKADLHDSIRAWETMTQAPNAPADLGFLETCDTYVFDMNGVLVNDEHDHFAAFAELARAHRKSLTHDEYEDWCLGRSDVDGIRRIRAEKHLSGTVEELLQQKQAYYLRYTGPEPKLYPKAEQLIEALVGRGKQVYLVTASSAEDTQRVMAASPLRQYFTEQNTFTDSSGASRTDVYQRVLEKGHDPETVAVVDDSPENLALARERRMRTIGVATTRPALMRADQVVPNAEGFYELVVGTPSEGL